MRRTIVFLELIAGLASAAWCAPNIPPAKALGIIITRPVNVSPAKTTRDQWFAALSQELFRFRLAANIQVAVVPFARIVQEIPAYAGFDRDILESEYVNLAKVTNTAFMISQKFEITDGGRTVQFYAEVLSARDGKIAYSVEKTFPAADLGAGLDSCILQIQNSIGAPPGKGLARFFEMSMLSNDPKTLREIGEIIILDRFSGTDKSLQAAEQYEALLTRDTRMELAYWCGAAAYARARHYNKAAELFKSLYDIIPDYIPLYLEFAHSLRMAKDLQSALTVAKQGEARDPSSVPLLIEKADLLEAVNRKAEAEKTYEQVLSVSPQEPQALVFFARLNNERGRPADGLRYADAAIKVDRTNGGAWFQRGEALRISQKFDDALQAYSQAVQAASDDPFPAISMGDVAMLKKDYSSAVRYYEKAVALLPNEFEVHNKAALANRLAGAPEKAAQILKAVEPRFSSNSVLQKELGLLELQMGEVRQARRHLEMCLAREQNDARVFMALGTIYADTGMMDDAFRMYNSAMPIIDDKNACRLALARLFLQKSTPQQAMGYLNEIISNDPKYRGVNRYLGDARNLLNDRAQALAAYLKERELYGDDVYVQRQIAQLCFSAGNWQQAETEGQRLIKLDPRNGMGYYRLAIASLQLKKPTQAAQCVAQAQALAARADQEIWFGLGQGYALNEQYDRAVDAFRNCLSIAPLREDAWSAIAACYIKTGNDTSAADAYVKLFGISKDKYKANLADAGHIYFRGGRLAEARRCYQLFLDSRYADPKVNISLAFIEYGQKNHARVIALLKDVPSDLLDNEQTAMMLAESYCAANAWAQAVPVLSRVTGKNDRQQRAQELLAQASEKTGDLLGASRAYEAFLALPATPKHRDYAFHTGELYEKQGSQQQSLARYDQNIRSWPEDPRNYEREAALYTERKEWSAAEEVLTRAVTLTDAKPYCSRMLAQTYLALRKSEPAIMWFQKYLAMAPGDSAAWQQLGSAFYSQHNYSKAIEPLKQAAKFMPRNFDVVSMLGMAYYENGQFADAIKPLSAASDLKPADATVLASLVRCYRSQKDTLHLIGALQRQSQVDPKSYGVRLELGGLFLATNRVAEAIAVLSAAAKIDGSNPRAYKLLARAYEMKGEDNQRLVNLNIVLQQAPRDADANFEMGRYYLVRGQDAKAEPFLKTAIDNSEINAQARFEYGRLLLKRNATSEALPYLDEAVKLDGDDAAKHAWLAWAAACAGKTQFSLAEADNALSKNARDVKIIYLASQVYGKGDQTAKAKELLIKAIAIDGACIDCWSSLGGAYIAEADYKQAVKALMKAWELGGFREDVVLKLARALSIDGKYAEAKDFLIMILAKNLRQDRAVYELCHAYIAIEQIAEAEKALAAFEAAGDKTGWTHLARGEIYEARGAIDNAWISFNVAERLLPDNPQVEDACGRINLERRQFDDAILHFGKALATDANNPALLLDLAKAYEGQNNLKDALDICNNTVQRYPDNTEAYYVIGRIKSKQGDHAGAIDALKTGLAQNPRGARLCNALGYEYAATGQNQPAIDMYLAALKLNPSRYVELYRRIGDIYRTKLSDPGKAKDYYQKYIKAGGDNAEVKAILQQL